MHLSSHTAQCSTHTNTHTSALMRVSSCICKVKLRVVGVSARHVCFCDVGLSPVEVRYAQGEFKKFDIDGIGKQRHVKGRGWCDM